MATSNFLTINTTDVYAINADERYTDEIIDDVVYKLQAHDKNIEDWIPDYTKDKCSANSRNFPAQAIATKATLIGDIELLTCYYLRSGYYQDYNLDFEVIANTNYGWYQPALSEFDDSEQFAEEIAEYSEELTKQEIEQEIDKAIADADKALQAASDTELAIMGTFSNGETIYKAV